MLQVKVLATWCQKKYTKQRHKKGPAFIPRKPYLVQGFDHDDEGNGFVILINEYKEIWWVNNRHVRALSQSKMLNHLQAEDYLTGWHNLWLINNNQKTKFYGY